MGLDPVYSRTSDFWLPRCPDYRSALRPGSNRLFSTTLGKPKADDFEVQTDHESVNRARLRIDTRKWLAGKLKPKAYGERQTVDVNHGVQDLDEIVSRAKQAAARLGITLPLHLLGRQAVEKAK